MKSNPIYPCLWFDGKAREAADFYCSVFEDASITSENQTVVVSQTSGQTFMCLNDGPGFCIGFQEITLAVDFLPGF